MWSDCTVLAARTSRANRPIATSSAVVARSSRFRANSAPSVRRSASNTEPTPPRPSSARRRYLPPTNRSVSRELWSRHVRRRRERQVLSLWT